MRRAIEQTLTELEAQRSAQAELRPSGPRDRDTLMLAVGPETGKLLNTLLRATGARRVLEIGGSMGYSTVWQGEAVEANGGKLTTLERVPSKVAILKERVVQAELGNTVEIIEGDATEIVGRLDGPFDFVLIDAWKADYPAYFDAVFPKLRNGGLIVADNILRPEPPDAGIQEYVRKARNHPEARSQLLPVGSGLELTVRVAGGPRAARQTS
jgi:predicted O-methyltransferase YrrM